MLAESGSGVSMHVCGAWRVKNLKEAFNGWEHHLMYLLHDRIAAAHFLLKSMN